MLAGNSFPMHAPLLQNGVAPLQAMPQPPQLCRSFCSSMQTPAQTLAPAGHEHPPSLHVWPRAPLQTYTLDVRAPLPSKTSIRCPPAVQFLARGLTYEEVGQHLGVSVNTVRTFVRAIYEKLDVTSRTDAVLRGTRLGLVQRTPYPGHKARF